MMLDKEFDCFFLKVVQSLSSYLGDLICIGGCANALYRFHELASHAAPAYLGTKDIDWAVHQKLPLQDRKPLASLMAEAGFNETCFGSGKQAVIKYCPTNSALSSDLEFLCPLSGLPGSSNKVLPPTSHEVQTGLMAQPLRYLEILFQRPWVIDLGRIPEFKALHGTRVQVPNPSAYVVQKVLIRDQQRGWPSLAKDCYYIYEISVLFHEALDAMAKEYANIKLGLPQAWIKRFRTKLHLLFRNAHADGPASALRVYQAAIASRRESSSSNLNADMIVRAVNKMLERMQ